MINPLDVLDGMIEETMVATRDVPYGLARYGVELGIGTRLALLKEVRSRMLTTLIEDLEAEVVLNTSSRHATIQL